MPRLPGNGWRWQSEGGQVWLSFGGTIYTWHVEVRGFAVSYLRKKYRTARKDI